MTSKMIVVEELDRSEVPDDELMEFTETQPIIVTKKSITSHAESKDEEEEILKFVNGEVAFPDYYTTNDPDEEDDIDSLSTCEPSASTSASEITDSAQKLEDEIIQSRRNALRGILAGTSKDRKGSRRRTVLSPSLQGLMGEANLSYARGNNEMAEKICLEIIRQNPLGPEPFLTLAQVYETKDQNKFLQFSTIAAHLERTDRDQWIRVADMNIERGNLDQARVALSRAIKYLPKDVDLRLKKAQLLQQIGDERRLMTCYYQMFNIFPPEKGAVCLKIAKKVAQYFHKNDRKVQALYAMQCAFDLAPSLFTVEDLNIYLELLIMNNEYFLVLTALWDRQRLSLELEGEGKGATILNCSIPDEMLPDFRSKICVSLVHLKVFHLIDYLINNILEFIPIDTGTDWYMDIVEALMKEERFADALRLLDAYVKKEENNTPPYIWFRHADCHRALGNNEVAIQSYYEVVKLAPCCYDARFTLSALLKQQGKCEEAIEVLEQDIENDKINPRLLYERCLMLKNVGDLNQYIDVGYYVLLRHFLRLRNREEIITVLTGRLSGKSSSIKALREYRMENIQDDGPEYLTSENDLTVEDEFELFKDLVTTCLQLKRFGMAQKLAVTTLTSSYFKSKLKEIEIIVIFTSLFNSDPICAFSVLREEILRDVRNNSYWNLFNRIIQLGDDPRYRKFLNRILLRVSNISYLNVIAANYYLSSGSYKYALNDYIPMFKKTNDPLIALLIGVALCQIASQKNVSKKPTVVMHAIAFLRKYRDLRISPATEQEVYYNLGRLHHHVGIMHMAVDYYEKALDLSSKFDQDENSNIISLRREIAYNLHLIYKLNGNFEKARKILYDHIVI